MDKIFSSFLLQTAMTVGTVFLFGFLLSFFNGRFYKNTGRMATVICYITGIIGTVVHELSHALFCVIFLHKIYEVRLFQIDPKSNTMGYVSHGYNPKNLYQRIGNFFIGVAPIVAGPLVLWGFAYLLVPNMAAALTADVSDIGLSGSFGDTFAAIFHSFLTLFSYGQTPLWWLFMAIAVCVTLHMTLSASDMKNSLSGLLALLFLLLAADSILAFIGGGVLELFTGFLTKIGGVMICILSLSLMIALLFCLLSWVMRLIVRKR